MVPVLQILQVDPAHIERLVADDLRRGKLVNLVQKVSLSLHLRHQIIAGGNVAGADAEYVPHIDDPHKVVVLRFVKGLAAGDGSRGHHPDHLPLYQPFGLLGVLHLLGDGHLVSLLNQLVQVGIHSVIGDAAHGRPLRKAALLSGQRQLQLPGGGHGILKEHLVEIAQPVEKETVGILLLRLHVMSHHR